MLQSSNKPTKKKVDKEHSFVCMHRPLSFTSKHSDGEDGFECMSVFIQNRCHHRFFSKEPNTTHLTFNLVQPEQFCLIISVIVSDQSSCSCQPSPSLTLLAAIHGQDAE